MVFCIKNINSAYQLNKRRRIDTNIIYIRYDFANYIIRFKDIPSRKSFVCYLYSL